MSDTKRYSEKEAGELTFQRKDLKAELTDITLPSSGVFYVPGGTGEFKNCKITVLVHRGEETNNESSNNQK